MADVFNIEPDTFHAFGSEAEQLEKCKDWGLISEKASKTKTFFYKGKGANQPCSIIGFVDPTTAVIEFENKQKHCIHPSYLKEMQASNYTRRLSSPAEEPVEAQAAEPEMVPETPTRNTKKEKPQKLELSDDKVKMTATVKEFTTVPNNFSDTDDEVIIYEAVAIAEPAAEIGAAWSSHSATLKKLELEIGDTVTFEAKIIKKKLTKHPVPYKINNPSKIQKV